MKRRDFIAKTGFGVATLPLMTTFGKSDASDVGQTSASGNKKPNIVLIMSDDMGYSDVGCYGSEIDTPNLDRLAMGGLRFTQFYNTARSCPSRASLLTGLYPHQAGVGGMTNDQGVPGYKGHLNNHCLTIAEVLQQAGYAAYAAGKWHVTGHTDPDGPKPNWPLQRGFSKFYGTIHGAGSYYDPCTLARGNEMISRSNDPAYRPEKYYYTDAISDHAVRYIEEHREQNKHKPFFLYVAYTAPHWPMHALPADIAKYKGRYDCGWDVIRKERHERMKRKGVIDPNWEMSPRDNDVVAWNELDEEEKKWNARCMEVYAAMIDNMDQGIGRIADTLKASGELDNTLLIFLHDNGGCAEKVGRHGDPRTIVNGQSIPNWWAAPNPRENEPLDPDDLQPNMSPSYTRDGHPVRVGIGVMPGPADTFIAYGKGWANVSNTPFRKYKTQVHEGGISTPLIVHWPRGIEAAGELRSEPGHLIDLMATCVNIAGTEYPSEHNGKKIKPLEGASLIPVFAGGNIERQAIFFEHMGNRAIRRGKWKLVAERGAEWELYDLSVDRGEIDNLADKYPDRVEAMAAEWENYAHRTNVYPRK